MARRSAWLGGVVLGIAIAITACATVMGVDDAQLDPTFGQPDTGASTSSSGGADTGASSSGGERIDSGIKSDAGPCSGEACACVKNADCVDPVYNTCEKNACRQCSTSPDSCPNGQYCEPTTLACAPGCKNDAACTGDPGGTHCNPKLHRCVECVVQPDCPATKKCTDSGECADTCGGGAGCTGGKTCCVDVCVDLQNDPAYCNSCTIKCGGASPLCCAGKCVDSAIDKANCGKCGTACSTKNATPTCQGGNCQFTCTPTYAHCTPGNTGCDVQVTSVTQCGGCAVDCNTRVLNATGLKCSGGKCDYTTCNSGFSELDSNRADGCEAPPPCGGINQACCASGTACTDANSICNKQTNTCVSCLGFHITCDTGNDLCCKPMACQSGPNHCN